MESTKIPATYHMPSQFGIESLKSVGKPTAYIILGSAAHVTEKPDWQKPLLDFIIPQLKSGIPVLGICYGHQLMAHFFKSTIAFTDSVGTHFKEARQIHLKEELWGHNKFKLGYAHAQYVQKLGDELMELGRSDRFPNEIIKHKSLPFYGTQAHPEASKEFLIKDANMAEKEVSVTLTEGLSFLKGFYHFAKSI